MRCRSFFFENMNNCIALCKHFLHALVKYKAMSLICPATFFSKNAREVFAFVESEIALIMSTTIKCWCGPTGRSIPWARCSGRGGRWAGTAGAFCFPMGEGDLAFPTQGPGTHQADIDGLRSCLQEHHLG